MSARRSKPFVAVNCAALPDTLVESELFGIEKGVATGVERRVGRIESANGGTLFLDEIGDLSLTAQAKLLRVLQEREVEWVGGRRPVPVDVRVIAATNKDLREEIQQNRFRQDLYFRLNVIHVHMPALREIRTDIPLLAMYFLKKRRP
jgi:transcriptional regulator with GAF, ATPase, and Fis domain